MHVTAWTVLTGGEAIQPGADDAVDELERVLRRRHPVDIPNYDPRHPHPQLDSYFNLLRMWSMSAHGLDRAILSIVDHAIRKARDQVDVVTLQEAEARALLQDNAAKAFAMAQVTQEAVARTQQAGSVGAGHSRTRSKRWRQRGVIALPWPDFMNRETLAERLQLAPGAIDQLRETRAVAAANHDR